MDKHPTTVDRQKTLGENDSNSFAPDDLTLVNLSDFLPGCGIGKTTWYAQVRKGEAPAPVKVTGKRVAWVKSEVLAYRARLIAARKLEGAR